LIFGVFFDCTLLDNSNQWFARKPLTKKKAAYWADFYYGKYKGKMSISINKIGKKWSLN